MQCPTAVRTTESNSASVELCRTPRSKNNSGSPNTTEDRSTGGLALPAVPPATVREPRTDSHRLEFGETANLKSPTLRIPPRLREGECQYRAVCSFSSLPSDVSVKHGEQVLSQALRDTATDTAVQNKPLRKDLKPRETETHGDCDHSPVGCGLLFRTLAVGTPTTAATRSSRSGEQRIRQ